MALQEQNQLPTPALLIMGDVVALHDDLAWYNKHNKDAGNTETNWLRAGTAITDQDAKKPIDQQAHALSMIANLAAQQEEVLEQLVIG